MVRLFWRVTHAVFTAAASCNPNPCTAISRILSFRRPVTVTGNNSTSFQHRGILHVAISDSGNAFLLRIFSTQTAPNLYNQFNGRNVCPVCLTVETAFCALPFSSL